MQNILNANQRSFTEGDETKPDFIKSLTYTLPKAVPPIGTQVSDVSPYISVNGNVTSNSTMVFQFPNGSGFLYAGRIGYVCTCTTVAGDLNHNVGLNLPSQIDITSAGQPLVSFPKGSIKALVKNLPLVEQLYHLKYSLPLDINTEEPLTAGAAQFLTYTPLIASFLTSTERSLLLNVIGNLELRITFDSQAASLLTNQITAITGKLTLQTYIPKASIYQQMLISDWSSALNMSCTNNFVEQVPLTSVTGVVDYPLSVPYLVTRMHLYIQRLSGITTLPENFPIYIVSLKIGGVPYLTEARASTLMNLKARDGIASCAITNVAAGVVTYDPVQVVTIDFGLNASRLFNSGTAFMGELRSSRLSITCKDVTTGGGLIGDVKLFVVSEYLNTVTYMPSGSSASPNGMLMVSQNM